MLHRLTQECEYAFCLALETTQTIVVDGKNTRRLFPDNQLAKLTMGALQETIEPFTLSDLESNSDAFPRVVSLDWCVYSLIASKVVGDVSLVIKCPKPIDKETYIATGIS
jgi:DUF917 family protein